MKALFYTATAVFITLAGVMAFFALQTPSSVGGSRIVLDIDAAGMPAVETSSANAPLDPYANEKDDKPDEAAETAPAPGPSDNQSDAPAPQSQTAVIHETHAPPERRSEDVPPPPPGTALAGLQQDRPLFREVQPAAPPADAPYAAGENGSADPAAETAEPELSPPATDAQASGSTPAGERHGLRGPVDVASDATARSASTNAATTSEAAPVTVQAAVVVPPPVLPPPPVPVRRPNDLPAPGERVAAGGGNFAGVQFGATEVNTKVARVAILLRGVGRGNQDGADAIQKLPSAVSLGFLPYASDSRRLAAQARETGHEVIVQLPLEPTDYPATDPGPETLLTSLPPEQNAARLQAVLKRFEGHTGVTNLLGGKMLQSKASLKPLLQDIKARGLVYVGEGNNTSNAVRQVAREINLRFGAAQVVIDAQATPDAVDKALARLVILARQHGSAIGMGNVSALTVTQVQAWSEKLAAPGITLVPVGALAQASGSS